MKRKKSKESAQGLVEYALILVLISVVVIVVMNVLGPTIGNVFSDINGALTSLTGGSGGSFGAYCSSASFAGGSVSYSCAYEEFGEFTGEISCVDLEIYNEIEPGDPVTLELLTLCP